MSQAPTQDRRTAVARSTTVNGIDRVQVEPGGAALTVYFLNAKVPLSGVVTAATITGGRTVPTVPVQPILAGDWQTSGPTLTLTLRVTPPRAAAPASLKPAGREGIYLASAPSAGDAGASATAEVGGAVDFFAFMKAPTSAAATPSLDSSTYTLTLQTSGQPKAGGPALDPYFAHAELSFAAGTPTTVDCEAPLPPVAAPAGGPPIDYLAKDFLSFRNALLGFSALRYPAWQERSEADFGVMFLESLCSLADDLSYQQDRVAAEAYLDTATERRSIVRHARLVDYEPRPAISSSVTLQFTVIQGIQGIPPGRPVSVASPSGSPIGFETGTGLADATVTYPVSSLWNGMHPYVWDPADPILAAGATEMWVEDDDGWGIVKSLKDALKKAQGKNPPANFSLLLDTTPVDLAQPNVRQIVRLVSVIDETDPLNGQHLAHIVWRAEDALTEARDISDGGPTLVKGNLVPATQGFRYVETFVIPDAQSTRLGGTPPVPRVPPAALVRTGPNQTQQYLYPLRHAPLAWLAPAGATSGSWTPEIQVRPVLADGTASKSSWTWLRWLLDAQPFDTAFTIDLMRYAPVLLDLMGVVDAGIDYDGSDGATVRFGDDVFGQIPAVGSTFQVAYRAGGGVIGNVAADTITVIDPNGPLALLATAVTNPFPATGGLDEETADSVRLLAPEAYKDTRLTASLPSEFAAAAETLPWVGLAGASSRYTGSWLTMFTAAAPAAADLPTGAQARELTDLLERVRITGRQSFVLSPTYLSLDLEVVVAARPDAFSRDVRNAVLAALGTGTLPDGTPGFFRTDQHTFGQALERSALEAAVQRAFGVAGVLDVIYRKAESGAPLAELPDRVSAGADEIIRVDNVRGRPDAGSLAVTVQGGR